MATPRQRITAWMRERIADADEVVIPDLARQAIAVHRDDLAFLQAWFDDTAYVVAYGIGTQLCHETRGNVVAYHDAPSAADADGPNPAVPRRRWLDEMEHVGLRSLRIGQMTKADLLIAASEREKPMLTELHRIGLFRRLADKMGATQRVSEVFTEEQVDRWARLLRVKYSVTIPVPAKLATNEKEHAA